MRTKTAIDRKRQISYAGHRGRGNKKTRRKHKACDELVEEGGFGPPKRNATDLQSAPFGHSGTPPYAVVELVDGFEPPTC